MNESVIFQYESISINRQFSKTYLFYQTLRRWGSTKDDSIRSRSDQSKEGEQANGLHLLMSEVSFFGKQDSFMLPTPEGCAVLHWIGRKLLKKRQGVGSVPLYPDLKYL